MPNKDPKNPQPKSQDVKPASAQEGTVDRSSVEGKAVGEVVRRCVQKGVRCAVFGGVVVESPAGAEIHALSGEPGRAAEDLVELGGRLARALLGVA